MNQKILFVAYLYLAVDRTAAQSLHSDGSGASVLAITLHQCAPDLIMLSNILPNQSHMSAYG